MKRGNRLVVFLFILLSIIIFFPRIDALEIGGQTLIGTIVSIFYPPTGCDMITQTSGIPMFIPNRTLAEYNSFKGAVSRLGITLVSGCCGNGVVNTGEGCDAGVGNTNTACTASYGTSCSYCDTSCVTHTVTGPYCGDGEFQSSYEDCEYVGNLGVRDCFGVRKCGFVTCTSSCTESTSSCYKCETGEPEPEPEPDPVDDGCFTKETLIKTLKGEEKISRLSIEDKVLSYNLENNQFVYSQIQKLLIHEDNTNWYYLVKTTHSQVEVTDVHPFYIGNGLYAKIENLKIGDKIYVNVNGELVQEEILSKERVDLPKLITVYNLELNQDGPRNYFANGYLVHNEKVCLDCDPFI